MNVEGQCLPECIAYQNSIKNFHGVCPECNRYFGQNLECHIGREHKALSTNLKAVFQNILTTAPANANVTRTTPSTSPTVASATTSTATTSTATTSTATTSTATTTGAKQKNKTATPKSNTKKNTLPTRIQHKRAAKKN